METTRQQKRSFQRSDEKQTEYFNAYTEKFFASVVKFTSGKAKRACYKIFIADWKKYVKWNNATNENLLLKNNTFRKYAENFYLLSSGKDAQEEWKEYHEQLVMVLPLYKRIFLKSIYFTKTVLTKWLK